MTDHTHSTDMTDPDVRRRIFSTMPVSGTFTCDCEHTRELLAGGASNGEWLWTPQNKPRGYELYDFLGKPKTIVAPMVDQSELAFRLLTKRYGADLTYSPMINSNCFVKEAALAYRQREFSSCPADTNMILQFCGNNPEAMVEAARMVEQSGCKAIDLNLGCPQGIARKGHYGSFLMEDRPLILSLIRAMDEHISVPITAKIRIFPDPLHTLEYARSLVDAGAALLGVHGRLREAKGSSPGEADWEQIRMVKEALNVPVFANGNIWSYEDIDVCLKATGCEAVMSADSLLWEPRLFSNPTRGMLSGRHFQINCAAARVEGVQTALEYLDICSTHKTQLNQIKSHLFKMTHHSLQVHTDMRERISQANAEGYVAMLETYRALVTELLALEQDALSSCSSSPAASSPVSSSSASGCPREAHFNNVSQLGNVRIPERHLVSRHTQPADLESDYRKRKDESYNQMLEDETPAFDLFN